jgi:hypothetical protein
MGFDNIRQVIEGGVGTGQTAVNRLRPGPA